MDDGDWIEAPSPPRPDYRGTNLAECGDLILGPAGPIAAKLPGYQARAPQIAMCNLVGRLIAKGADRTADREAASEGLEEGEDAEPVHTPRAFGLIEAETGTGKSLANLIPAILSGQKVVISTATIQLQQQLIEKDLPFLEEALGRPVIFAIAKGRTNYFCERNADAASVNSLPGMGLELYQDALRTFRGGEWDGDKSTLRLPVLDSQWPDLCADDTCEGKGCKLKHRCPLMAAKELLEKADIIVANHTLVLLHHYVLARSGTKGILPLHSVWIADEAHVLGDLAQQVFGQEVSQFRPVALVRRLKKQADALGIDLKDLDLDEIERAGAAYFRTFHGAFKDQQLISEFPEPVRNVALANCEALVATLKPVLVALNREVAVIPMYEQERRFAVGALADSINLLVDSLRAMHRDESDRDVCYCELTEDRRDGSRIVTLHRKPAEVGGIFRNAIFPNLDTFIACSATLATGRGPMGFRNMANELGIDLTTTDTLQVESPFDYRKQAKGYLSRRLPGHTDPQWHNCVAREVDAILAHTKGRAFVLFTSVKDARACYDRLQTRYPIFLQGQEPKDELLRKFRETPNAVLVGVKTFWTGVDIKGEALSCVIIPKLPFPNFDHPLVRARVAKIEARGGNGFADYHLPRMIFEMKQGVGRLIRSDTDEGIICLLDQRLNNARYGKQVLNALPPIDWLSWF